MTKEAPKMSASSGPKTALKLLVTVGIAAPVGILSFPKIPQLALNFKLLKACTFFKKDSSFARQAKASDGKLPPLFSLPNLDEPSRLKLTVSKYLSLNA